MTKQQIKAELFNAIRYVAIDPKTGLHLREATKDEIKRLRKANNFCDRGEESCTQIGDVMIDTYYGQGRCFGGAGF